MTENFWTDKYPEGVAAEIDPDQYPNVQAVLKQSCQRYADKPAFTNLGKTITYGQLYELSGHFAAYLQQHTDLKPGDRIAVQLPNVLQYPVAVFGAMRAGLVVVNTNPLYTAREMEHQFNDSGAKALVCLANMAHLAEQVGGQRQRLLPRAPEIGRRGHRHEREADGEEHLVEVARAVEPAVERALHHHAGGGHAEEGERQRREEGHAPAHHQPHREVAAEHREGAVREVDEVHQPHRHRQAEADQEEQASVCDAVEDHAQEARHAA